MTDHESISNTVHHFGLIIISVYRIAFASPRLLLMSCAKQKTEHKTGQHIKN